MHTTLTRSLPRTFSSSRTVASRPSIRSNVLRATLRTSAKPLRSYGPLSLTLRQPTRTALVRYQSGTAYQQASFIKGRDTKGEEAFAQTKLVPLEPEVTEDSTIHPVTGEVGGVPETEPDVEMMAGVKSDFVGSIQEIQTYGLTILQKTIVETFSLRDVPREALYVGLAGVIPYLATSLSTVYLSFDIQYAAMHGNGILMSGETAEKLLHIIEPIQLGYGASVSTSFAPTPWRLKLTESLDYFFPWSHPLGS
jgi:hypothetical protein